jgi:hypothetical protein
MVAAILEAAEARGATEVTTRIPSIRLHDCSSSARVGICQSHASPRHGAVCLSFTIAALAALPF